MIRYVRLNAPGHAVPSYRVYRDGVDVGTVTRFGQSRAGTGRWPGRRVVEIRWRAQHPNGWVYGDKPTRAEAAALLGTGS